MDHPSRVESYKGHDIRIFVLPPVDDASFRAIYEIQAVGDHEASLITGVIAGDFPTADAAEEGAVQVAKKAIDRQDRLPAVPAKRKVEIFSAGCPCCTEVVSLVENLAHPSLEIEVLDMHDAAVASRAHALGVRSVPAVAIDGQLADCCAGRGVNEQSLLAELHQP